MLYRAPQKKNWNIWPQKPLTFPQGMRKTRKVALSGQGTLSNLSHLVVQDLPPGILGSTCFNQAENTPPAMPRPSNDSSDDLSMFFIMLDMFTRVP